MSTDSDALNLKGSREYGALLSPAAQPNTTNDNNNRATSSGAAVRIEEPVTSPRWDSRRAEPVTSVVNLMDVADVRFDGAAQVRVNESRARRVGRSKSAVVKKTSIYGSFTLFAVT